MNTQTISKEEEQQYKTKLVSYYFKEVNGNILLNSKYFWKAIKRGDSSPYITKLEGIQISALELIKVMERLSQRYEKKEKKPFPWKDVAEDNSHPLHLEILKLAQKNAFYRVRENAIDGYSTNGSEYFLQRADKDVEDVLTHDIKARETSPEVLDFLSFLYENSDILFSKNRANTYRHMYERNMVGNVGAIEEIAKAENLNHSTARKRYYDTLEAIRLMNLPELYRINSIEKKEQYIGKLEHLLDMEEEDLIPFILNEFEQQTSLATIIEDNAKTSTIISICKNFKEGHSIPRVALYDVSRILIKEIEQTEKELKEIEASTL